MHRSILFNVLLFLLPVMLEAQGTTPLSKLLWSSVNNCYSNFEDMDGDGKLDFQIVDESRNGYLKISGGWPTCGCECTSTAGAYKDAKGEYTLLNLEEFNCEWIKKISSNRPLEEVLPENFGINEFLETEMGINLRYPAFFLNMEIPKKGTDTKASLKLIPFGLWGDGGKAISFHYSQYHANRTSHYLGGISRIARKIKEEASLQLILDGKFKQISSADKIVMERELGEGNLDFKTPEELRQYLTHLYEVYQLYSKLECTELVLGWDREKGRFYIKNKFGKPQSMSFKEFLLNNQFWDFMC